MSAQARTSAGVAAEDQELHQSRARRERRRKPRGNCFTGSLVVRGPQRVAQVLAHDPGPIQAGGARPVRRVPARKPAGHGAQQCRQRGEPAQHRIVESLAGRRGQDAASGLGWARPAAFQAAAGGWSRQLAGSWPAGWSRAYGLVQSLRASRPPGNRRIRALRHLQGQQSVDEPRSSPGHSRRRSSRAMPPRSSLPYSPQRAPHVPAVRPPAGPARRATSAAARPRPASTSAKDSTRPAPSRSRTRQPRSRRRPGPARRKRRGRHRPLPAP